MLVYTKRLLRRIVIGNMVLIVLVACGAIGPTGSSTSTLTQDPPTAPLIITMLTTQTPTLSATPNTTVTLTSPPYTSTNITSQAPTRIASPTPSTTSPSHILGTTFGHITFQMGAKDVLQAYGEPKARLATHGIGTPEWHYTNGLQVSLRSEDTTSSYSVWKVMARPPFDGSTAEGFHLGDTKATFRRLYHSFVIQQSSTPDGFQIDDKHGMVLNALFDIEGKTILLVLTDQRCYTCNVPPGTPGAGKGP